MNPRDAILDAVRRNRPAGQHELPALPRFPMDEPGGRIACFVQHLKQMGGTILEAPADTDPLIALRDRLVNAQVICSAAPEIAGNRELAQVARPVDLADVDVAVVRAAFGVAETGSVLFTEAELQVNALAYLAQHLVVLLDPADIVGSIQDAYGRAEFRSADYAVFHTGPSATADIEGVLIHGAQGVRSLTVVLLPRQTSGAGDSAG
jgi:L-lactate dehydrogenase complex protein LldG